MQHLCISGDAFSIVALIFIVAAVGFLIWRSKDKSSCYVLQEGSNDPLLLTALVVAC